MAKFNRHQLILFTVSLVTLLLASFLFWQGLHSFLLPRANQDASSSPNSRSTSAPDSQQVLGEEQEEANLAQVTQVIDGDTIEVGINESQFKVRLIGVDTPETVDPRRPVGCFGKEAANETKRLLEGKVIKLEKDLSETDRFGRLLRYVYLQLDDGNKLFLNDYLIRQGFGYAVSYPPDVKYATRFQEAQREAEENRRGLWDNCQ